MTQYIKKTGTVVVGNSNKRILVTLDKIDNAKHKVYINGEPSDCNIKITVDGTDVLGKGGGPNRVIVDLKNGVYQIEASHPNCHTKIQTLTVDVGKTGIKGNDIYLDFKDEYQGLVDFVSTKELHDNVWDMITSPPYDLATGTTREWTELLKYFKIKTYDNKIIYIPAGNSIHGNNRISVNDLIHGGFLVPYTTDTPRPIQGKIVTIAGKKYRCRLLNIDYPNRYDQDDLGLGFYSCEANRLLKIIDESSYKHPAPNITVSLLRAGFGLSGPSFSNNYFAYQGWWYSDTDPVFSAFWIEDKPDKPDYTPMLIFELI